MESEKSPAQDQLDRIIRHRVLPHDDWLEYVFVYLNGWTWHDFWAQVGIVALLHHLDRHDCTVVDELHKPREHTIDFD